MPLSWAIPFRVARLVPKKLRYYVILNAWIDTVERLPNNWEVPSTRADQLAEFALKDARGEL